MPVMYHTLETHVWQKRCIHFKDILDLSEHQVEIKEVNILLIHISRCVLSEIVSIREITASNLKLALVMQISVQI